MLSQNDWHLAHLRRCPQASAIHTGELLRELAGLSHVHTIPIELLGRAAWTESSDQFSTDLGAAGANYLECELGNAVALEDMQDTKSLKIGVSGGRSIYGLFSELGVQRLSSAFPHLYPEKNHLKVFIEPLVVGPVPHSLYSAMSIAELAVQKFDNSSLVHIAENRVEGVHFKLEKHQDNVSQKKAFDFLILGIGGRCKENERGSSSFSSHIEAIYSMSSKDPRNVVGDICSRLFEESGDEFDKETGDTFIQLELNDLKVMSKDRSRRVVAVAGGKNKVKPISVALKNGWVNSLITDELTARMLIRELPDRPKHDELSLL